MNDLWRTAPVPAMRGWQSGGGEVRWEANEACQAWCAASGWDDETLVSAVSPVCDWPAGLDVVERVLTVGVLRVRCRRVALSDGWVLWLSSEPDDLARWIPPAEQLDLMMRHGRMGLLVRNLSTGEGLWDRHTYAIMGLDPARGTPDFQQAMQLIHPDDRDAFARSHDLRARSPGTYSVRFRIVRPDGTLRYLNSLCEVREGAPGEDKLLVSVLIDDTEGVLRYSEQRNASDGLARALSLSGLSVWQVDLASQRIFVNEAGFQMVGLPNRPEGMPLPQMRSAVHPADLHRIEQAAREAMESDRVVDALARYSDGQGGWRHLMTRRFAQRDPQGRCQSLMGVSLDLTELVQERDRSLALLDRMRLVAEAIGVGFWWRDLDAGTLDWDERMYRLHHRPLAEGPPSLEEFLQRHVHPEDQALLRQRQALHIADWPSASELTFRILTPDGQVRWIQSWTRRLWREGRRQSFGMHVDVTAQRESELRTARERERDRFAIEASGVGVWERPVDGRPPYWSHTMYGLRGLDPADPRPLADLIRQSTSVEHIAEADAGMRRSLDTGAVYRHEFRVTWPDGQQRWLMSSGHVMRDGEGRPVALAGVTVDITERRRAEQLARERDRAEQASAAKSELMARVSHELRTPMNAVLGFAELMSLDTLGDGQRERLDRIRSAGKQLLALIDDLLVLAQNDGAAGLRQRLPVDLLALLDEARHWVAPLAQQAAVRLAAVDAVPPVWVLADRRRLGQVLTNLLTNAIKYNRPDGAVRVTVRPADGGAAWCLTVGDDGRGMSPSQQARLFEPFNRLGVEREGIPGTGIGLSIVKQLLEDMHGRIEVQSEVGRGSSFSVTLPAATPEQGPVTAGRSAARDGEARAPTVASAGAPLKVLYVEDNPVNAMLVEQMLQMQPGYALTLATDGREGIAAAQALQPQVLLLDLQLPDMTGLELLRRLQALPALAGSRFVALSANAMPADVQQALDSGFDAYWTKPLDVVRFLADLAALADSLREAG